MPRLEEARVLLTFCLDNLPLAPAETGLMREIIFNLNNCPAWVQEDETRKSRVHALFTKCKALLGVS